MKDVDLAEKRLTIRGVKGGKDRVVGLPEVLRGELEVQMRLARAVWRGDSEAGAAVPGLLAQKSPRLTDPGTHPNEANGIRWIAGNPTWSLP